MHACVRVLLRSANHCTQTRTIVATVRIFHLDDFSPKVGEELCGEWTGQEARHVDDTNSGERTAATTTGSVCGDAGDRRRKRQDCGSDCEKCDPVCSAISRKMATMTLINNRAFQEIRNVGLTQER